MKRYLFCPGPVTVSERVKSIVNYPDIGHRMPQFEMLFRSLQEKLLQVYKADKDYTVLFITGSGTSANEAVISSYFQDGDEALLVVNGEFALRFKEMLETYRIKATILEYKWGSLPNLEDIEDQLKKNNKIKAVLVVFHETSTSVINPVSSIGKLAKKYGKVFIVDAVSALGGEDVNVVRDNIDFCTSSANKCLASLPGIGIICAKIKRIEEIKHNHPKSVYLNLNNIYKYSQIGQTPNTPSITMFRALEVAVTELLEECLDNRIERYKRCVSIIRKGLRDMGLKFFVDEKIMANTLTSVFLPKKIDSQRFIQRLDEKGFTVYSGKRHLKEQNMIQIGNMGAIYEETCYEFLKAMFETLEEFKK